MAQKIDDEVIEKIQPIHGNTLGELLGKYAIAKMAQHGIINGGNAEADPQPEPDPEPQPEPQPEPDPEPQPEDDRTVEILEQISSQLTSIEDLHSKTRDKTAEALEKIQQRLVSINERQDQASDSVSEQLEKISGQLLRHGMG